MGCISYKGLVRENKSNYLLPMIGSLLISGFQFTASSRFISKTEEATLSTHSLLFELHFLLEMFDVAIKKYAAL